MFNRNNNKYKYLEQENKELKKYSNELLKFLKERKEKDKFKNYQQLGKLKTKISKLYFTGILATVIIFTITVFMIIVKISIVWIFIFLLFAIPIFLGSNAITLIKLYRDRNKIKNFLIKKVAQRFIIANFYTDDKKFKSVCFLVSGNEFNYGKNTYLVDNETIWYDIDKNANIFYREGIPNPIILNFNKMIDRYNASLDKTKVYDDEGNLLDLSYSSETLQKFKKDKIFSELHSEGFKDLALPIIIFVGMLILIIIIVVFTGGNSG